MSKYKISNHLSSLVPYQPVLGDFGIKLDANESFIPLNKDIRAEMIMAVSTAEINLYPHPYAHDLCKAYASFHGINMENIVAGNGSDELISLICQAFLRDNANILTLTPDFSMYSFYATLQRANVMACQKDDNYNICIDTVIDTIAKNNIDVLIFSNPCNPTGQALPLNDVLRLAKQTACLVVVDEAYMDFSHHTAIAEVEKYDNLIVLRTMSKAFAAASLRLGFAIANTKLINVLRAVKSPYNVSLLSQQLGEILLKYKDIARLNIAKIIDNKNTLYKQLCQIKTLLGCPFEPIQTDTNFVYIKTDKAEQIYNKLMNMGILIRCFDKHLRITTGSTKDNNTLIECLNKIDFNL